MVLCFPATFLLSTLYTDVFTGTQSSQNSRLWLVLCVLLVRSALQHTCFFSWMAQVVRGVHTKYGHQAGTGGETRWKAVSTQPAIFPCLIIRARRRN